MQNVSVELAYKLYCKSATLFSQLPYRHQDYCAL